jgi:hypothetical protein
MATNLEQPSFYLDQLRIRNDSVFGFQIYPDFDVYQVLGIRNAPSGTKWTFSPDWLSDRGFALGTDFRYDRFGFLNIPGPVRGDFEAWGIQDSGWTTWAWTAARWLRQQGPRPIVLAASPRLAAGFEFTGRPAGSATAISWSSTTPFNGTRVRTRLTASS